MKKRCMFLTGALAVVVLTGLAQIAEAKNKDKKTPIKSGQPTAEAVFKFLDKDGDDKLTAVEFKDTKQGDAATEAGKQFKQWDSDGDDSLTQAEYKAGMDSLAKASKPAKPAKAAKKKKK